MKDIVLVQQFRRLHVVTARSARDIETQHAFMIGWESERGFRAASLRAQAEESFLFCAPDLLTALDLSEGTEVGVIPFL
jgi:arginine/ornithine N-succinyltransferase beta subunit